MRLTVSVGALLFAGALLGSSAQAADQGITGKKLLLKTGKVDFSKYKSPLAPGGASAVKIAKLKPGFL
jgi:hypothetical protein